VGYLVDSSIWIEHLKKPHPRLMEWLDRDQVLIHSAVVGELACGRLKDRRQRLGDLLRLPPAREAAPRDVFALIENGKLFGIGLGWVDCQLLASALLSDARLVTRDQVLAGAAKRLGISA
jgi:predicted nucleic acid-binding protein